MKGEKNYIKIISVFCALIFFYAMHVLGVSTDKNNDTPKLLYVDLLVNNMPQPGVHTIVSNEGTFWLNEEAIKYLNLENNNLEKKSFTERTSYCYLRG